MLVFLDFTRVCRFHRFLPLNIFSAYLGIKSHIFCFKSCKKVVKHTRFCNFTTFYNSAIAHPFHLFPYLFLYFLHLFLHILKVNMGIYIKRNPDIRVPHDLL